MDTVRVLDKSFCKKISYETIQEEIYKVAQKMNEDLKGKEVIFIGNNS